MLKFTDWAIDELEEVMRENNNELAESCGYGKRGTIFLHYETEKPEKMPNCVEQTEVIKYEEALKLEPTLQHLVQKPVWATYEVNSATGDSERFTKALAKKCKAMGVQFLFNTTVQSLETRSQRIKSVRTNRGKIPVSQNTEVIVAAGTWTPKICATIDLFVPIFGLKGYSIAVDNVKSCEAPKLTVVSDHFYITRLGDQLRCSSMGEFSETANTIKPRVDRLFRNMGKLLYPNLSHLIDGNSTRTGLRPLSADGIPLLGRVGRFRNLSVNVGPGFSGWKNSVGAAKLLVQEIKHPEYSTYNFNPSTFFPDNRIVHSSVWSKLSLAWWGWS